MCLLVVKRLGCELVRRRSKRTKEPTKSNFPYNLAGCYGCGKELKGAARASFLKKCKADACAPKAVSSDGKPLSGAAKNSFMKKCEKETG